MYYVLYSIYTEVTDFVKAAPYNNILKHDDFQLQHVNNDVRAMQCSDSFN
jgi:hypothetical protein